VHAGRRPHPIRTSLLAASALVLGSMLTPPASADPSPSIDEVQRRVDELHHQAEQASERFNTINAQLGDARRRLRTLAAKADEQADATELLRQQVEQLALAQVEGSALDNTTQLLLSDDPDEFVSSMAVLRSYSERTADLLVSYEDAQQELTLREEQSQEQVEDIADAREQMAVEKAEIDEKADAAEALLGRLEAEERARLEAAQERRERISRDAARPPVAEDASTPAPASSSTATGSAAVAVQTALAQVGDAYVYGAAGPDAFDCSGLTMYAWAAAGVSLSHSSSIQSGQGTAVPVSDVQPGDLVFYYSPVSHVGMYIGNGMIVHAPNPSASVEVVPMDLMPVAWVRRVG
jgi:cell wall-associated NlpC family hydrolase